MNRLDLCRRLRREAGISGSDTTPVTTVNQTGDMLKVVEAIDTAYELIQNLHSNWLFLRNEFSFQSIANTQAYTTTALGLTEFGDWRKEGGVSCYLTSAGAGGEQWLGYQEWDDFRDYYNFGTRRTLTDQPIHFSIMPNKALALGPTPNDIYTVSGEYFKRAQAMTANSDEPLIPAKYHMIIMWRGLMLMAQSNNAIERYDKGEKNYKSMLRGLRSDQLPEISLAGTLV